MFVSPTVWERTVIVEEVLYTFGLVVLVRVAYDARVPRRFGGFVQVLQTVQLAGLARTPIRPTVKMLKFTPDEILEYVEMTVSSRPSGGPKIPWRFGFFV